MIFKTNYNKQSKIMKIMTSGSEIKAFQGSVMHFSNFKVFPVLMFIFEASQGFQDPLAILNVDSTIYMRSTVY